MPGNTGQILNKETESEGSDIIKNKTKKSEAKKTSKSSRVKGKHPLEIEYWFILPAIRRELALCLREKNIKQRDIAEILGITEPAVSQYIHGNRGKLSITDENGSELPIDFPDWLNKEINKSVEVIYADQFESTFIKETNRIMLQIRNRPKEFLCNIHEQLGEKVDDCQVCIPGVTIDPLN